MNSENESPERPKPSPSVYSPTNRELGWWIVWQFIEKLLRLAVLAGVIYAAWWWWKSR